MKKQYRLIEIYSSFDNFLNDEIIIVELTPIRIDTMDKNKYTYSPFKSSTNDVFVYCYSQDIISFFTDNPEEVKEIELRDFVEGTISSEDGIRKAYKHTHYFIAKHKKKESKMQNKGLIDWVNVSFGSDHFKYVENFNNKSRFLFDVDENTVISYKAEKQSLEEFVEKYFFDDFLIDASQPPKRINSPLGYRNMFFAKMKTDEDELDYRWTENRNIREQYTINYFNNFNKIFGAPEEGFYSPLTIDLAFSTIRKKIKSIRHELIFPKSNNYNPNHFLGEKLGSFYVRVDFLNEHPFVDCIFKSKGFALDDIESIIEDIYLRIPN